jgi:hypothetical protein
MFRYSFGKYFIEIRNISLKIINESSKIYFKKRKIIIIFKKFKPD